ncbi:MAG: hypothetical protein ACXWPM_05945 [Bdellovibrionota bacterium]
MARLLDMLDIHFALQGSKAELAVASVSLNRLRLLKVATWVAPGLGKILEGHLVFNWDRYPVKLREELDSTTAVDFILEGSRSALHEALDRFYGGNPLTASLYETPPELLQPDPAGESHLFRGDRGLELLLVLGERGEIRRFTAALDGHYLEGGRGSPTHWGTVLADELPEKAAYKGSALIGKSTTHPAAVAETLAELAGSMPNLMVPQRTELAALIRSVISSPPQ